MSNFRYIYGKHASYAALTNSKSEVRRAYISQNILEDSNFASALKGVNYEIRDKAFLDRLTAKDQAGGVHQGIVLECRPVEWYSLQEITDLMEQKKQATIVALDQVTDPHNLGAILRNCQAFGVTAVIVTKDNSAIKSPVVAKVASGALEHVPVCVVANLSQAIKNLQNQGFWAIALDANTSEDIDEIRDFDKKILVLGAEGAGLRALTKQTCDITVKIPIHESIDSLNVSATSAIALYVASLKK